MKVSSKNTRLVLAHPLRFAARVFAGFRANQGFLLAGAVAYYTLLSIVPIFALILAALSRFGDTDELLASLGAYLQMIAPGQVEAITAQVSSFLDNWQLVGVAGFVMLLFFSSFAFTALENSISVIFFHRVAIKRRHFLVSAIIPYIYILVLALGLLMVSIISGAFHSFETNTISIFGQSWPLTRIETTFIYQLGLIGEVFLLTSLYMVMPVGGLPVRHAMLGGITAALLWELTRHLLVWYFSTLSLVNLVYGTFATVIIVLISLEVGAIILLLGAQVIAEYERLGHKGAATHGLQTW